MSFASLYVYYKVDPERLQDLRDAVVRLLASIERETGVHGRWERKFDDSATYMEVYPHIPNIPGFQNLLARECDRLQFERYLAPGSTRRSELFVAVD